MSHLDRSARCLSSFPRVVTSLIFQNLDLKDILNIRESSPGAQIHVDDHIRRRYIKWKQKSPKSESLSHDEILLLSVDQFAQNSFTPPYILTLIEKTQRIAESSGHMTWRELLAPRNIEGKEKLLKFFYEQANEVFSAREKKVIFTLTILQMLKALCSSFQSIHPFNRKASLRIQFDIQDLFFAVPSYNFIPLWFSFDCDWIPMLLLFTKFLEIKAAIGLRSDVKWVNLLRPMEFKDASVIFGKKNMFSRGAKSPSKVKCCFLILADRDMIEGIKAFLDTGEFDWQKVAKDFTVHCELSCLRAEVCKVSHRVNASSDLIFVKYPQWAAAHTSR